MNFSLTIYCTVREVGQNMIYCSLESLSKTERIPTCYFLSLQDISTPCFGVVYCTCKRCFLYSTHFLYHTPPHQGGVIQHFYAIFRYIFRRSIPKKRQISQHKIFSFKKSNILVVENFLNPSLYIKEQSPRRKFENKSCL